MSVVILGGNECMERQYKEICKEYNCKAKVFARPIGSLKNKLGSPDLMIFFTSTMSHKMVKSAMSELKGSKPTQTPEGGRTCQTRCSLTTAPRPSRA